MNEQLNSTPELEPTTPYANLDSEDTAADLESNDDGLIQEMTVYMAPANRWQGN